MVVLVALVGCGESAKQNGAGSAGASGSASRGGESADSGGQGGSGGAKSANGGSAGSGAASAGQGQALGDSAAEACIAYALAACSRTRECAGQTADGCIAASTECPDLAFSPGSTRTVAALKECAAAYAKLPCDQVNADILPPCVTPGQRARGESCLYNSQCSTLICKPNDQCGTCAIAAGLGESCAARDVDCGPGAVCSGSPATCQPYSAMLPSAGESCAATLRCAPGSYCDGALPDATCRAAPAAEQHCGPEDSCAKGSYCGLEEFCHVAPAIGQPCAAGRDGPDAKICATGLHCDESVTPPACAAPGAPGAPCESLTDCEPGMLCDYVLDSATKVCLNVRFAGESCSEPNSECHPAFDCVAGVCRPAELRNRFANACPGIGTRPSGP